MPLDARATEHLKIFLSYARADIDTADALVAALETAGFVVTIDRRDLPYGEQWQQVLSEYIRDCDTVVFLVSRRSVQSQWVRWELQQVTELRKRLVPLVLEPCEKESLPPAIASVELLPKDGVFALEPHAAQLVQALNTNRAWVMDATKLSSRTLDWINAGKTTALLLRAAALEAAERWRAATPKVETISSEVLDFLLSSRQHADRRRRFWVAGSLAVAIGASVLAATAYLQSVEAGLQRDKAERQTAVATRQTAEAERQSNAAIAQSAALTSLASDNDPARSLLLAREALRRSGSRPSVTTLAAHRNAVFRFGPTPLLEAARRGLSVSEVRDPYQSFNEQVVTSVEISANGRWLVAVAEENGTRELWRFDLEHLEPASTVRVIDTGLVDRPYVSREGGSGELAISDNGHVVANAPGSVPGVFVFDIRDDGTYTSRLAKWSEKQPHYGRLRFSDDERYLAHGNHFWRLRDGGSELKPVVLPDDGRSPFFSGDSARVGLVAFDEDRITIKTWSTAAARAARQEVFDSFAAATAAYPRLALELPSDDDHFVVSSNARWEISWNAETVAEPIVRHRDPAGKIDLEKALPLVVGAANRGDDEARAASVRQFAFSGDGRWLATIRDVLQVWDLSSSDPFVRPRFEVSVKGTHVAIDPSGRWVASFGNRLQVWDLSLDAPAAFPIETASALAEVPTDIDPDDLSLRFVANGTWLAIVAPVVIKPFVEFWDLRFDNVERDADLAGRNLSEAEWRSVFGDARYRKTFTNQPMSGEPMREADNLARSGNVTEAVEAYKEILAAEPEVRIEPEQRAARLASQFFWLQGQDAVMNRGYEPALPLLRHAKQLNPAIPWNPDERAGQLWAQEWSTIVAQLVDDPEPRRDNLPLPENLEPQQLLLELRKLLRRYPRLRVDARTFAAAPARGFAAAAAPEEGLYELGLRALAERTRRTAGKGDFEQALQWRSLLDRERSPDLPTVEELRKLSVGALSGQFRSFLRPDTFTMARDAIDRVVRIDGFLAERMRLVSLIPLPVESSQSDP